MAHTIDIIIDREGNIESTVRGIKGAKCSEISKWVANLGLVTEDKKTKDFYQSRQQVQNVRR